MSEEKTTNTAPVEEKSSASEEKQSKKSLFAWFNRIWSAVSGFIVGLLAMFGIDRGEVAEIKSNVQEAIGKVQEVQMDIKDGKYIEALSGIIELGNDLKDITGDVKEAVIEVKENIDGYKADVEAVKEAVEGKDWIAAKDAATELAKKISDAIPEDQLTGKQKEIYDSVNSFVEKLDNGDYDSAISIANKVTSFFSKKKE